MIIGKTTDGCLVMDGEEVFNLYDRYGIPLSILFCVMKDKNIVIDFVGFFKTARRCWEVKTIFKKLEEGLTESHGSEYAEEVSTRLGKYNPFNNPEFMKKIITDEIDREIVDELRKTKVRLSSK